MFWNYLEREVMEAEEEQIGLVIEIDSNSWAGNALIPNDPNKQNSNGKLLELFLNRNKGITIVNSLPLCDGLITRKRTFDDRVEKSAIDLFLVCNKILPVVTQMLVDEKGEHQLSNFQGKQHKYKVTESDHAKVELKLNLEFQIMKPVRNEVYNFKSEDCKAYFNHLTTNTRKFSMCFQNKHVFTEQIKQWQKNLKTCIIQSFPKIRSRKRKFAETHIGQLLEERKRIKLELITNPSTEKATEKSEIDAKIAKETELEFMKKVKETLGHITGDDGSINTNGIWKAKQNLIPKHKETKPVALKDNKGNMITSPEGIKTLCLDEMIERLRHRPIHPELVQLQFMKEKLCHQRINIAKHIKTKPWTEEELESVLRKLKRGRCRDPQGLINELFQDGVTGTDLKKSLLHILNKTKDTLEIPEMMKYVNVVMLPKPGKPGIHELENQRGVFLISVFRSILMKLLLKDKYEVLDSFMTDSNIGARKDRRIQDHLFIVNGILYENARSKKKRPISICIYDCRQCFDSMWQDEVANDIYEAGVQDDKLALLYEINKINKLAVKTPHGLTERKVVEKIICQGDPWGPLQCSVQVDSIGRESLQADLEPFKYKDKVEIPVLGMMDDILTITESGHKTARMNAFITAKIATKKLQLGPKKCFVIHTGKEHEDYKNIELYVDGWSVKEVNNVEAGKRKREDTLQGDMEISHIEEEKYLGQTISSDGRNTINIQKMKNKGI